MALIPAVELIYRDLARPRSSDLIPAHAKAATKEELTRADVDAILQRKRGATPEELEYVIAHSKEFSLSDGQRDQVCCDLTITAALRSRQVNGRRVNPSAEFIAKVLGYAETPHGLIDREWIGGLLRAGAQSIARCKNHQPPKCQCWSASRAILWQARANGENTPQAWAAGHIYDFLAGLELASRPEREPGVM